MTESEAIDAHHTRCPDCGAKAPGGREGCQAAFDEAFAQAYQDLRLAAVRDLAFDAYCMQHLDTCCRSSKSYVAHLARLYCGLEHAGSQQVYAAIQRSLNGTRRIAVPGAPSDAGGLTIADVASAESIDERVQLSQRWAESVWEAYSDQQDFARSWIRSAVGQQ